MSRVRFDPETYLADIRADVPVYDELQDAVAEATRNVAAKRILELGVGTGETARRVLELHAGAELVAIDENERMLTAAREVVAGDLRVARFEDELPAGPFDLVVSALAVHHLDADGKRDLFRRVRRALRDGGRFVLADVVVPERPEDAVTPTSPGFDRPSRLADQLLWLREAGFVAAVVWRHADLAVVRADVPG